MAKELKADPVATKFFDDRPELKNQVFAALRRDSENREIRQYVPDLETAKMVTQAAGTFQRIDNKFLKAETPEGAREFLNEWIKEAMIVGDDGKPVVGEDGKYKLHPALSYVFDHISTNKLSMEASTVAQTGKLPPSLAPVIEAVHKFATQSGDERLQAAADIFKEAMNTPSSSAPGEVPENLKAYADSLKAKEDSLTKERAAADRQRTESHQAAHQQSIDRAETKAADAVRGQLQPRFDSAGLTKFEQDAALRKIGDLIDQKLEQNQLYQSIYDSILGDAPSEAREKRLTRHMLSYTNESLGPIVAQVLREAKGGALARQTAKQTTVAGQQAQSRIEPRGTSITPVSPQSMTPAQLRTQVVKEYRDAHQGDDPDVAYITKEMFTRVNAPRKKA